MIGAGTMRETELALLNAPFEPEGWLRAAERVTRACGGHSAHLAAFGGPQFLSLDLIAGESSDRAGQIRSTQELWGAGNWRIELSGAPLSIHHDGHYAALWHQPRYAAYTDLTSDLDSLYGCQSVLIAGEDHFIGFAVLRGRRAGPCDALALERFAWLLRPLHQSVSMQLALDGEAAEMMLEARSLRSRVVLLDRRGAVRAVSVGADRMLGEAGCPLRARETLHAVDPREDRLLQRALADLMRLAADAPGPRGRRLRVGGSLGSGIDLRLVRLVGRDHALGFEPHVAVVAKPSRLRLDG